MLEQGADPVPAPAAATHSAVTTLVVSGKTSERSRQRLGCLRIGSIATGQAWLCPRGPHPEPSPDTAPHVRDGVWVDRGQAVAGLRALAAGRSAPGIVEPQDGLRGPGTVFVYSGQGSQWAGMGRQLLADEPRSPPRLLS